MISHQNYSLKNYNSFGIDEYCRRLSRIGQIEDLSQALDIDSDSFILGGGSNMLLRSFLDKHVLLNRISGKEIVEENADHSIVKFGGGENWHDCVLWSIENGLGGLENLSLIPGTMGAAPIQNIGAYGVELKDVFHSLSAVELESGKRVRFNADACQFGYRDSVFKKSKKGKYFIVDVTLRLSKRPELNLTYGAIASTLEERNISNPSLSDVSKVVCDIRQSKLPDPSTIGNSGSFFKNPVVSQDDFDRLKTKFDDLKYYQVGDQYKIPAGWMIDKCGWKGHRKGNAGVYENQALVLVNHGNATGVEIWSLAEKIMRSVEDEFGIRLTPEVNIL